VLGEAVAEPKQVMLDLFGDAEMRKKSFEFTKEDIDGMSDMEAKEAMEKYLEEQGAVFVIRATEAIEG
jgi:hypothetical protein